MMSTKAILPSIMDMEGKIIQSSDYMKSSVEVGDETSKKIFNRLSEDNFVRPKSPMKRSLLEGKLAEDKSGKKLIIQEEEESKRRKIRGQFLRGEDRRRQRIRRMKSLRMTAPVNTTQFLMSDMSQEDRLSDYSKKSESEGDFAKQEFSKDYERETLGHQMKSKSKLIEEYVIIENDVNLLEKKYEEMTAQESLKARLGEVDYDWEKGEIEMEPEIAEKIRIFQEEILKLVTENSELQVENNRLVADNIGQKNEESDDSSSDDSSDDSSSDDSDSESDSSSDDDSDEEVEEVASSTSDNKENEKRNDTGYDSDKSTNEFVSSTTLSK